MYRMKLGSFQWEKTLELYKKWIFTWKQTHDVRLTGCPRNTSQFQKFRSRMLILWYVSCHRVCIMEGRSWWWFQIIKLVSMLHLVHRTAINVNIQFHITSFDRTLNGIHCWKLDERFASTCLWFVSNQMNWFNRKSCTIHNTQNKTMRYILK